MKLYKYLFLIFVGFMLMTFQPIKASPLSPGDSAIVNFFKESISYFPEHKMFFSGERKISLQNLDQIVNKIWALWKKANLDMAQLPEATVSTGSFEQKFPVNYWELPKEDPMPFYFLTKGKSLQTGYPLFVNLHGSGQKDREFEALLLLSLLSKESPSLYFIPQIPNTKRYRWYFQSKQYAWEKLFRLAMIDDRIDANKIYMMGFSEGAYGSQRLGAFYADYLAGAGPVAGGEPLENAPPLNYKNTAFSFITGEYDSTFGRNILTKRVGEVFDSLQKNNPGFFHHNIIIQPGKGHAADPSPTAPWLKQFTRNAQPSSVSWVNFPMDGRYRTTFYNIGIDKELNISDTAIIDRAVFNLNMNKANNTIHLEVWLEDAAGTQKQEVKTGEISIYLSPELIDLSKRVKLFYKGKLIHDQKVALNENVLVESCALFGDPDRLFPARIKVVL